MKNGNKCPKCESENILKIPVLKSDSLSNYIPTGNGLFIKPVYVSRYLCEECGYSEEWIDSKEDIEKLKKKYKKKT